MVVRRLVWCFRLTWRRHLIVSDGPTFSILWVLLPWVILLLTRLRFFITIHRQQFSQMVWDQKGNCQPLAQAILQSPIILRVFVGEKEHKTYLYVDDVLLFLTNPSLSAPGVIDTIAKFSSLSGYKINFTKSKAMPLGSLQTDPHALDPFPLHWSPTGFVYLGIRLTPKLDQMYNANFTPLLDTIKGDLDRWAPLPLSWLSTHQDECHAKVAVSTSDSLCYPFKQGGWDYCRLVELIYLEQKKALVKNSKITTI